MKNAVRSRHARGLLHVVRDDHDRVIAALSSSISSSILPVEIGSSAEQGSSMRSTSGFVASARAMHRRCCWPPDIPKALFFRRSLTSSHSAARLSARLDDLVHVALHARRRAGRRRCCRRSTSGTGWASGRPCRCACAPGPGRRRGRRGRRRGRATSPSTRAPGIRSFIRFRQRRNVDLPQPDGPISAVISFLRECAA